jgi:hypothetical protein
VAVEVRVMRGYQPVMSVCENVARIYAVGYLVDAPRSTAYNCVVIVSCHAASWSAASWEVELHEGVGWKELRGPRSSGSTPRWSGGYQTVDLDRATKRSDGADGSGRASRIARAPPSF